MKKPSLAKVLPAGTTCEFCGRKNRSWPVRRYLVEYKGKEFKGKVLKANKYANVHWGCSLAYRSTQVMNILQASGKPIIEL